MFSSKPRIIKTTNNSVIEVYEYCVRKNSTFTLLPSEIVIATIEGSDLITFYCKDQKGIYYNGLKMIVENPTLNKMKLYLETENLFAFESSYLNGEVNKEYFSKNNPIISQFSFEYHCENLTD